MMDRIFTPWGPQKDIIKCGKRTICAFAGKRGGKTEIGAIKAGMIHEYKPNEEFMGVDPYLGVIMAPTRDMLTRLSWKKFTAYWHPFCQKIITSPHTIHWHDHVENKYESMIIGVSATHPERIEGIKAFWIWIDEAWQIKEQMLLEILARTADTEGYIILTGSLGVQFVNPKQHYIYKTYVVNKDKDPDLGVFEWASADNPYFKKSEIEKLKRTLDAKSFQAMFTITYDLMPKGAVYEEWDDDNEIQGYTYNPKLETYISIDWGWTHPMSCGFYQYDRSKDFVYKFGEIVGSRMTLDQLYQKIVNQPWIKTIQDYRQEEAPNGEIQMVQYARITNVTDWVCDIAGSQEREQIGFSNIRYLKTRYKIKFKCRSLGILKGIGVVRSYIKNSVGKRRFFVDVVNCPKTVDGIKRYKFPEKDGIIINELPEKKEDDEVDETRYFFVNVLMDIQNKQAKISSYA